MTAIPSSVEDETPVPRAALGDDAIAAEIRIVQSVQAQRNMPPLLAGLAAAVAVVAYVDWTAALSSHAVYFLALAAVMLLPMLRSYFRLRHLPRPKTVSKRRIRVLEIYSYLLGLVWAAILLLVLRKLSPIDGAVIVVLTFTLCFGSAALSPGLPKAAAGFSGLVMAAAFAGAYFNDIVRPDVLVLLVFSASFVLARTVWQNHQDMTATVRLGLEKSRAEAEIHQRETGAISAILEAVPFPLVVTRETAVVHASARARQQFGIPAGEMSGLDIRDFFADRADQEKMRERQDRQGRLEAYEVRLKNARGEPFWVSLSTLPLKYEGQDCWLNAIYDIDDRKRAEVALAEKEAQLRLVMDHMRGGIRLVDKERNYVFFNRQYLELYDFPEGLLKIGESNRTENLYQAERGDFGPGEPGALVEEWRDATPVHSEATSWERTTVLGKTLQVHTSPTPGGGFVNIVTDITERKLAEAEAREKTRILELTLENMGQGLVLYDGDWNLVTNNRRYAEHFDLALEVFEGETTFDDIVAATMRQDYPGDWEERLNVVRDPSRMSEVWRREFTRPTGRALDLISNPLPGGGFVVTSTDITQRKSAEADLLEAKQKVEEQNRMLETVSTQLAKYISPQLYQAIFSGQQKVAIESKRKKLTVFFSDIAGFTEITDQLESEELTALLNQYLTAMSKIGQEHGANFDKFIGDAMMFYFGDPESKGAKEDAAACIRMAIAMQRRVQELREEWRAQGVERSFQVRMGINTGYCTVGNFGSEDRMDYTIIGSEVNLAARLQSHADIGGILLANETYALVKDWLLAEQADAITVKGFAKPVTTFRVKGIYDELAAQGRVTRHEGEGVTLTIDHERLSEAGKAAAMQSLEDALARLRE